MVAKGEKMKATDNMIYTSYFAKLRKLDSSYKPINIAIYQPRGLLLPSIKELFPSQGLLRAYKNGDINNSEYTQIYRTQLNKLKANDIVEKIRYISGEYTPVLICYEKSPDFCHRHLVAGWLRDNGNKTEEWSD